MCYAYMKEQSAAQQGSVDQQAPIASETSAPAKDPVAIRDRGAATSYARFLVKMRRLLAARKREEPTSV